MTEPMGDRLRSGAYFGFAMGAVFSLIALLNALLSGGSVSLRGGQHVELFPVLRSYLLFGPVTGALFGAFLPQLRNAVVAYVVGCVISIPILLSISSAFPARSGREGLILSVIMMLAMGGPGALIVRSQTKFPKHDGSHVSPPSVRGQS